MNITERMIHMTQQQYIDESEQVLLHTYTRYQIVLDHGEGAYLYDTDGKKYLDFVAGIAVHALGHGNRELADALKQQLDRLVHVSNLYYTVPLLEAAKKATKAAQMDRVFFTNSGAEAIEGAVKSALKYAYTVKGGTDYEVIAMNHSFHGRTLGALSVTGNEKYRAPFAAFCGAVKFAEFNDLESVRSLLTDKTCAIILEPVQGEGGIYPASQAFLEGVRKLCDENGILLIFDEIQCGMGRTGAMFTWQRFGVKPDIMAAAKALGCGIPVGAFFMTEKVAGKSLTAGDHGSTYAGNPLATTAVSTVLDIYERNHIIDHVNEVAPYLEKKLQELSEQFECIETHRGIGLMQGLVFKKPVADIVKQAIQNGLLLATAGTNIIRFVPPLIITKEQIDEMADKLAAAIKACQ